MTDSEEAKRRLETALSRRAPDGLRLALDMSAPRPVITPFTLRFGIDADGARFDACSADTEEARDRILGAAAEAGLSGQGKLHASGWACRRAAGRMPRSLPSPSWPNSAPAP